MINTRTAAFFAGLAFLLVWLFVSAQRDVGAQPCCLMGVISPVSGFVGAGNIVASPTVYYALRAETAALRGNKLANVCWFNGSVDTCADFLSNATTGQLVFQTLNGHDCTSDDACTVQTMYDQTVGGACGGSCDATNATRANRPTLKHNCIGTTLPCLVFNGTQELATAGTFTLAQTYTITSVCERTANTSAFGTCIGASTPQQGFSNSATHLLQYAGNVVDVTVCNGGTCTESVFHAISAVYAGVSSTANADGSTTATSPSTGSFGAVLKLGNGNNILTGALTEAGVWATDFSAGVSCASQAACLTAMNSNLHGTSGWNF